MFPFEVHVGLFRLSKKRIFNAYVLWPFGKNFLFELVTRVRTREYTLGTCRLISDYLEVVFYKLFLWFWELSED